MRDEIILYQNDLDAFSVEVKLEDDTLWLTQNQIVDLFDSSKANISEHIKHIFESKELNEMATVRKFRTVQIEGERSVKRERIHYNLDVIISVGYRVNSLRGTQFRIWANNVLKDYMLKGYCVNNRFNRIESDVSKLKEKVEKFDLQIQTSLPPNEGIFFNGQIYDAYSFVSDIIRSAKQSIILIDNYIDDTVLTLLNKRQDNVEASIYTSRISKELSLDIEKHNQQYPSISIEKLKDSHDRFLVIDKAEIYHIGASVKDLGKKWFAFSKLEIDANIILEKLK